MIIDKVSQSQHLGYNDINLIIFSGLMLSKHATKFELNIDFDES